MWGRAVVRAAWAGVWWLWGMACLAQPAAVASMPEQALAELLARPLAGAVSSPRTRGELDLKGRRFYIAEYRVLIEQSGELVLPVRGGRVLGQPVSAQEVTLAYHAQPDVALLQALVDRGYQDLLARLAAAQAVPVPADEVIGRHGAIHAATEPGSTADQPVLTEATTAGQLRRHLHFSPQGMRLVKPSPGGIGVGDLTARLAYRNHQVEALSLTLAINLATLDPAAADSAGSPQALAGAAMPSGGPTAGTAPALSPQMELGPAPSASLIYAHGQVAHINLTEAFTLTPAFARLRLAELGEAAPRSRLSRLVDAGRSLGTGRPRLDAVLELDGARTARLLLYSLGAANQAMADALAAAR